MDKNKVLYLHQLDDAPHASVKDHTISLLIDPSTGFVYPIEKDDYRFRYNSEDATVHMNDRELIYLTEELAGWAMSRPECAFLTCRETTETVVILENFLLGRINCWPDGTLSDRRVSRVHGKISCDDGTYVFTASPVPTKNGTFVNRKKMDAGQQVTLKDGDILRLGRYHLVFSQKPIVTKSLEGLDFDENR